MKTSWRFTVLIVAVSFASVSLGVSTSKKLARKHQLDNDTTSQSQDAPQQPTPQAGQQQPYQQPRNSWYGQPSVTLQPFPFQSGGGYGQWYCRIPLRQQASPLQSDGILRIGPNAIPSQGSFIYGKSYNRAVPSNGAFIYSPMPPADKQKK